ncbi:ABC transporter permease [Nakamurella lactea]|uniref:ABC transporter permease n=1 Tax=Nakamurella lactea TaxID=459515 RepID=UPI00040E97F1|nr:ABC transporter permease [Nakamurella lactea]
MAEVSAAVTAAAAPIRRRRRDVVVVIALVVLAVIVIGSLFAPWLAPHDPTQLSRDRFAGPSAGHLLGTDELGRDLLSRIMYAGRITLSIAGGAALIAMILGAVWGMAAAFARGLVDEILMRLADTAMAVPQMLLALVFVAAFGSDPVRLAVIVGVLLTPVTARMVRSAVLTEKQADYYRAAIAYGASRPRLVLTEVLPNVWAPIGVQAAINVANAIALEAGLSFIGLGIQDPDISWGLLVKWGYEKISRSLGYVTFPALAILITIWMLNLLADQLGRTDSGTQR